MRYALTATALVWLLSLTVVAVAQTPAGQKPRIEVATIKPSKPDSLTWAWCHGADSSERGGGWIASRILLGQSPPPRPALGRCLMTGVTMKMVMGIAYLTFPYKIDEEIAGGPSWAGSDRFDIETKADNPAVTEAQLSEMLQQFLSDRFKLTFHRTTKEVTGYALVVAKGGTKLRVVSDPEAETRIGTGASPGGGMMPFQAAPISALAEFLSRGLGKRVQDQTGLTGKYTFTLTWTPVENEVMPPGTPPPGTPPPAGTPPPGVAAPGADSAASLITAIQEQLGLKLESAKVPVPVLMIDSVQRPTEN